MLHSAYSEPLVVVKLDQLLQFAGLVMFFKVLEL